MAWRFKEDFAAGHIRDKGGKVKQSGGIRVRMAAEIHSDVVKQRR
ncbi:hypothetical protein COLO4_37051 [Corchorus olitorius]|uniref:Uncharacterized protein n=1 Tax=Corchorus olitorius TaxID=93759 RepID=A0A1R3G3P1_9ROSI|nr:hypothetical protein COLO4_37051 [Corchorus olitorius]